MWAHLTTARDIFDDAGALSHLSERSLRHFRATYGQWLCWLQSHDGAVLDLPPTRRATPDRLKLWLQSLAHTRLITQRNCITVILRILQAAEPKADWTLQNRLRTHLHRVAGTDGSDRKRGRILSSRVLLDTGMREATETAEAATTELSTMKARRDGALIAFLALLPIRRRALAGLELGVSLLRAGDWLHVALPPELTKTGQPWDAQVPDALTPLMLTYLDHVRPWFLARGGMQTDIVWVMDNGRPFDPNYLGTKIRKITQRLTGVPISPHLFRDAGATTLVRDAPGSARLVRGLLGHSDFRTAERHYIHATGIDAGRSHAAVVQNLQKGR
ncbi:site-specific integrase [Roseicyclus mahoneyensis]|nr:site-specific integrase [Roseicyclus mahoneyensis]